MPNIAEFNAGDLRIQPSQAGIEAETRSAYRLGAFGRQQAQALEGEGRAIGGGVAAAGDAAVQFEDHREISAGAKNGADMLLQQEQSWNNLVKTADPNDPSVAAKFREQTLEPALQNFQSGFNTQKSQEWATRFVDQVREHMFNKTAADQSSLAGIAIHDNALKTANTLAGTAFKDPSSIGIALDSFNHSLEGLIGSSPTLSPEKAAEIKETFGYEGQKQIVSAAVHGAIANGGDWRSIANNPKYAPYVNAAETEQFERAQRTQDRINASTQKQIEIENRTLASMKVEKENNEAMIKNVTTDSVTGHVIVNKQYFNDILNVVRNNPDAPNAHQQFQTMNGWGEAQQKPPATHDDPLQTGLLLNVVGNPAASANDATQAIMKAEIGKMITPQTAAQLKQLSTDMRSINDPLLTTDLKAVQGIVEPKISGVNLNPGAYANFYYDFIHNNYLPAKVAGTLPPNALDMNDPKSMISQAVTKATGGPQRTLPAAISANGGVGAPLPVYTAPKSGAPAAPAVALPPLGERKAGQTYPTPRGPMQWTGKGWIAPQAETGPQT